jgi:phospholipid/cholesterol/gamma-HCH transport system substrate-binding protein
MESEAKYTLVGAAVLILLALAAATVVWLRSSGEGAGAQQFKIYFEQQSLEGLELRSYVTMRGIRVGSVTGFRFSSSRPGAVEVFISVDPSAPVRQNTQAIVERHLVTGLASVRLVNPNEDSPLLEATPPGEPYPVIAEGESTIQAVSDTVTQLARRADDTMQRVNEVLSPENRKALAELLENLRRLSRHADQIAGRTDATLASLGAAADEVRALSRSIASDAGKLTARYDQLGAQAGVSLREMNEAVRKISADVSRLADRADSMLAGGDEELRATGQSLRSAADAVGAAAARLREPRQILYGPAEGALGPGEGAR